MLSLDLVLQVLWTSVASSSYQALLTVAFALVLKVTRIWNFTQAALMGIAFYAMYTSNITWQWHPLIGVLLALCATCVVGAAIERYAFRTLRERQSEPIAFFIFTLIFAQFVIYGLSLVFTTRPLFLLPDMMSPTRLVGGVVVSQWDLQSLVISAVLIAGLWLFLRITQTGQFLIAVADNPDLAEVYGIDRGRIYIVTMIIASIFITAAAFVFGTRLTLHPQLPTHLMIFAIAATILGGIGKIFAAAIAAFLIGILQQFSVLFIEARWQPLVVFAVLFTAIIFFPQGVRLRQRKVDRAPAAPSTTEHVAEG